MANGHGGLRRPEHPAPVAGPGALSRRTDGKQPLRVQTDQDYGDRKATLAQEQAAPMHQVQRAAPMPVPNNPQPQPGGPSGLPGFGDPSNRPWEPVTQGAQTGPGAGPEILPTQSGGVGPTGYLTNLLQGMAANDATGTLADLYLMAKQRGA